MHLRDILFIVLIIVCYLAYRKLNKNASLKKKNKASDWLQVKQIDEDGLITTEDNQYLYIIEVMPIPDALKSTLERGMIWSTFKDLIDILPHSTVIRAESHPYNLEGYFEDLKLQSSDQATSLQVIDDQYIQDLQQMVNQEIESTALQDKVYYLRLLTNPRYLAEMNTALENPVLHEIMKNMTVSATTADYDTIRQELKNSIRITQNLLHKHNIWTYPLMSRESVLAYIHKSVNREEFNVSHAGEIIQNAVAGNEHMDSLGKIAFGKESVH
ncbi:hypothetical protein L2089_15590 [Paenibacillus hunanensis]|uniref:hypothetical protein n=1 Tax=Paenibacillus hunanensis TaxID=539262 RepID=UPI0020271BA8|nr:hypothetical protein [Paenibacillus hunanensis]MCL9662117.1 hypothetical protein [Paenibacillus hunanensis]